MKKHKYLLETYGCEMNKAEEDYIDNEFGETGWERTVVAEEAEIVILNTCAVRQTAENRVWGRLGKYAALKRKYPFTLTVMGCMAERLRNSIKERVPEVDNVVGTFEKIDYIKRVKGVRREKDAAGSAGQRLFPESYLGELQKIPSDNGMFDQEPLLKAKSGRSFYLPIMHGCNNFCSYCIVPYVRGPEISRRPVDILEDIKTAEQTGIKEIVLLGQNVNSYYSRLREETIFFPDLLQLICKKIGSEVRVRFLTSHPKDFSKQLVRVMQANPILCRHIHLPVQSGSDKILMRMNRGYSRTYYLELIDFIKEEMPEVTLSTDIMVGFPGESGNDFDDTISLVKKVGYVDAFMYKYNPREGTKAYNYKDEVSEDVKTERLKKLIDTQQPIGKRKRNEEIGKSVTVLVENISKKNYNELIGRTDKNIMVVFPGNRDMIGQFADLRITSLAGNTLRGEVIL